jgi:hypothetical protein
MKRIDLTNQRFGSLTAIEIAPPFIQPSGKKVSAWKCQCDCGNTVNVRTDNLRNGHTTSCGCACGRVDIAGKQFGRLTVSHYVGDGQWECECECGNRVVVQTCNLNSGNTKSCGCLQRERSSEASLISLIGNRYGKLTVIERVENNRFGHVCYRCKCECGGETIVDAANLRNGNTNSCGCIKSKGEMIINNWLQEHGFDFRSQYSFDGCVLSTGRRPFFDFVLFKNDKPYLVIEYNGRQHYEATGGWNTEEEFAKTQRRDSEKLQWCEDNHYPVLVIKYDEDIEKILGERLL